jgi:hypothetical protein
LNRYRETFEPVQNELYFFKKLSLSSQKYGFGIRDPRSGIRDPEKPLPDSGSRDQNGTGTRIRIRNTASNKFCTFQHFVHNKAVIKRCILLDHKINLECHFGKNASHFFKTILYMVDTLFQNLYKRCIRTTSFKHLEYSFSKTTFNLTLFYTCSFYFAF